MAVPRTGTALGDGAHFTRREDRSIRGRPDRLARAAIRCDQGTARMVAERFRPGNCSAIPEPTWTVGAGGCLAGRAVAVMSNADGVRGSVLPLVPSGRRARSSLMVSRCCTPAAVSAAGVMAGWSRRRRPCARWLTAKGRGRGFGLRRDCEQHGTPLTCPCFRVGGLDSASGRWGGLLCTCGRMRGVGGQCVLGRGHPIHDTPAGRFVAQSQQAMVWSVLMAHAW